jgi:hypothetical protein
LRRRHRRTAEASKTGDELSKNRGGLLRMHIVFDIVRAGSGARRAVDIRYSVGVENPIRTKERPMHPAPLVATTRGYPQDRDLAGGYAVENIHHGSIAVVDVAGRLLWSAGDPDVMTFTRSALKPFQALPFVLDDGPARFGFTRAELALLCASHSGEEKHLVGVTSILDKIGVDESQLACGCAAPLYYDAVGLPVPAGRRWRWPTRARWTGRRTPTATGWRRR